MGKRICRTCVIGLLTFIMAAVPAFSEGAETLKDIGLEVMASYKKADEFNPLYTQRFGADPGAMEYEGRLYVYMTADTVEYDLSGAVKENSYSKIHTINCISSDDLVNWTDHGQIRVAGASGAAKWAGNAWAPCAAHKTIDGQEKFFLYFCNGGNGIGVLTSDSPTGPWSDPLGKALIDRSVPECADVVWLFDPAVMVDEDGTGYLAFGGGVPEGKQAAPGTGRIVRLGEDMISLDGDPVRLDVPYLFEDSGINKIGGKYIYSYCSNWQTEGNPLKLTGGAIEYMVADNQLGPYTYAGELFPNEGRFFGLWGNNHHSIACLNGEYYLLYHSRPVEKAMGISGNYRSPQIDRILFKEDGSFQQVVGTMKGVAQLKSFNPYASIDARTMSHQAGTSVYGSVKTEPGSWIRITGVDFGDGADLMSISALSRDRTMVYALLDSLDGPIAATFDVLWGNRQAEEYVAPFKAEGIHDLYFVFEGEIDLYAWEAYGPEDHRYPVDPAKLEHYKRMPSDRMVEPITGYDDVVAKAEELFVEIYGEEVLDERPFIAEYDAENGLWLVTGTLIKPKGPLMLGGVAFAVIENDTGRVLYLGHEK